MDIFKKYYIICKFLFITKTLKKNTIYIYGTLINIRICIHQMGQIIPEARSKTKNFIRSRPQKEMTERLLYFNAIIENTIISKISILCVMKQN